MPHTSCVAVASKYNKYSVEPPAASVALRQFAVAVHEADGVSAACVSLQDSFDVDVTVLLLAAYIGAVRGLALTAEDVGNARMLIDGWHTEVVRPLRAVRRLLKSGPAPAPSAETEDVRGTVAKAELDAELVELDSLQRWAAEHDGPAGPPSTERAVSAMKVALGSYSCHPIGEDARRALATIAAAAVQYGQAHS